MRKKSEFGGRRSEPIADWSPKATWIADCIPARGKRFADLPNPQSTIHNPKSSPSGITLLEVLISIFVLAVGLLGLASMLPVAGHYAGEAQKFDRGSTLAQAVYHDLQLRGYLQPKSWLDTQGNYAVRINTSSTPISSYLYDGVSGNAFPPPVVIDPLAISYATASGQAPPPQFPAFLMPTPMMQMTGTMPTIYRLTLDSARSWPTEDPQAPGGQIAIKYSFADRLFRSTDDLNFRTPQNADLRPTTMGTSTPDYQGDYSWLLTVSPDVDDIYQQDVANMQRYTVSVVVFYKRVLNLDQNNGATLDVKKAPPERMVYADLLDASAQAAAAGASQPFGINYSGGAVRLRTPDPSKINNPGPPITAAWLDVKPNEWLMLSAHAYDRVSGSFIPAPGPGVPTWLKVFVCQWYRIAGVGDTVDISGNGGGPWYRDVQLAGPDWDNTYFAPNSYNYPAPIVPNAYAVQYQYATLVAGAIAVYDYEITIDGSLLKD